MSTLRGQKLGFRKELEVAAQAGYDGVEIWINSLQEYLKQGHTPQEVRRMIGDLGIKVEDAIGFATWIVDDPTTRRKGMDQAKQEMELLAEIGCPRTAAPPMGATEQPGLDLMAAAERYRALLEIGDQTGVVPQLEIWGFSKNLHTLAQVMFVAVASQHPQAHILPDVYHLYRGGSDIASLRLVNGEAIDVFHMNDYPTAPPREQLKDSHRLYPGDGTGPLVEIIKTLYRAGGPKLLSLELFNEAYWKQDALQVAKTGLAKMKAVVEKAMQS
ncbi:sugar phosphate isomerase/epimerase family protein [Catalinimonas alkaloidigena]|nr:sugar phosphate isomerase/epimerase family protein [Catalinimonas alkaloidigena]